MSPGRPPPKPPRRPDYDTSEGFGRRPRRRAAASEVIVATLVALLVGSCLGSGALVNLARTQDLGSQSRDIALPLARANDRTASFFSLDRPADAIDDIRGDEPEEIDVAALAGRTTPTPTPAPTASPEASPSAAPATSPPGSGSTPAATVATTPTATPSPTPTEVPQRPISAEDPLRLYVGGDSMARELGEGIAAVAPVDLMEPTLDFQNGRGLSRPDAFDWPQHLAQVITADSRPDVVALIFGANDFQGITNGDGSVVHYEDEKGSDAWLATYRERVALMMDLLNQPGLTAYWVGLPIVRDAIPDSGVRGMNQVYQEEAASRPWITYVDAYTLFSDANGGYTDYLGGELVRQSDGVHWSIAGSQLIGRTVWDQVATRFGIA